MKVNNKLIPNINITLKEFKELLFKEFKGYPMMSVNYKSNQFTISQTFYDGIDITQNKISKFCKMLNINHGLTYNKVIINLI